MVLRYILKIKIVKITTYLGKLLSVIKISYLI